jgi:DNA-binding beta-propeller fold protein YncE
MTGQSIMNLVTKVAVTLVGLSLLAGCGSRKAMTGNLVWPSPPELERIRYVRTISNAEDMKISKGTRWKQAILGEKTVDRLIKPFGVATDSRGRIFVTDGGAYDVLVFNEAPGPEEALMTYLGEVAGTSLSSPLGITVDNEDRIYVGDVRLNMVKVFSPALQYLFSFGDKSTFGRPAGLAYNKTTGEIIVLDSGTHDIKFFSRDGTLLRTVGGRGSKEGYFNYPTNVACDRDGNIYVVDTINFRIQVFDPMGEFLSSFGQADNVPGSFSRPRGIALDSEGHVYVSDGAFSNVQIFQPDGRLLLFFGGIGSDPGQFRLPAGLWFDGEDRLYVADQYNQRVQIFQYVQH